MRDPNIDRLIEGLHSPFWVIVREEFEQRIQREVRGLRACGGEELRFIQGRVDALEWALRRPEEILADLREKGESPQEETNDSGGPWGTATRGR